MVLGPSGPRTPKSEPLAKIDPGRCGDMTNPVGPSWPMNQKIKGLRWRQRVGGQSLHTSRSTTAGQSPAIFIKLLYMNWKLLAIETYSSTYHSHITLKSGLDSSNALGPAQHFSSFAHRLLSLTHVVAALAPIPCEGGPQHGCI